MVKEIRQNTAFLTFRLHDFLRTKSNIEKTLNVTSICGNVTRRYAANNIRNATLPEHSNPSIRNDYKHKQTTSGANSCLLEVTYFLIWVCEQEIQQEVTKVVSVKKAHRLGMAQ